MSVCLCVAEHMSVADVRSRFCCMESDRYRLTVLFLKTFFRSWALSVKLQGRTQRETDTDIIMHIMGVSFLFHRRAIELKTNFLLDRCVSSERLRQNETGAGREASRIVYTWR